MIDYDVVKKYCGQEMSFRLQGAVNNLESGEIKIANTGMVSSGKSSLYNVLTENVENERFPTGAARTTTIADSYHYHDLLYIDTPGIDVRDIDDDIAFGTIMEADLILIIHNIKTGPLTKAEYDWVKRLGEAIPDDEARRRRLIFVCTWKDMREKEEGYQEIYQKACEMVFEALNTEIRCCDVSVLKYQNGIKKEKPLLCEKSGINELRNMIDQMAKEYAEVKTEYAREQYRKVAEEVKVGLRTKWYLIKDTADRKEVRIERRYSHTREAWDNAYEYFSVIRKGLDQVVSEVRELNPFFRG